MKFHMPMNAVVLPVKRNGAIYYFFLDTGCPKSFTRYPDKVIEITHFDTQTDKPFVLPLSPEPCDTTSLSEHLMMPIAGFLGLDFLHCFENLKIDFKSGLIDFDVEGFEPDFRLPFSSMHPLFLEASIEGTNHSGQCLVDTGAYQSLIFNLNGNGHPKSTGWRFPTFYGNKGFDFYYGYDVVISGCRLGKQVLGRLKPLSPAPFEYALGLNILSQYECCFDVTSKSLLLKRNPREVRLGIDLTENLFTVGIQMVKRDGKLIVSNVLPSMASGPIRTHDVLSFPEINLEKPEAVNQVYESLSSNGCEKDLMLTVNGRETPVRTARMFF